MQDASLIDVIDALHMLHVNVGPHMSGRLDLVAARSLLLPRCKPPIRHLGRRL